MSPLTTLVALILSTLILALPAEAQRVPITTSSAEARAHFEEGVRMANATHWEAARDHFDRAIAADPDLALAYAWQASAAPEADRQRFLDEAAARAGRASDGERLMIEAWAANLRGDRDRELELLEQAARQYPGDPDLHSRIGLVHWNRRAYDLADEAFARAIAADPDFASAYNMRGYAAKARGDYRAAEVALREYASLAPDDPNARDSLGELFMKEGRFREAREQFEEALRIDPTFVYAHQNIGNAYLLAGRYDDARRIYRAATPRDSNPDHKAWMQERIAESYVHEGDRAQARTELDRALEMARAASPSREGLAHYKRYIFFLETGDLAEAERSARALRDLGQHGSLPEGTRTSYELIGTLALGMVDARRGDHAAAREKAEAYVRGQEARGAGIPEQHRGFALGLVAHERGDFAEAARLLAQADPDSPYVLYRLGVAHAALGDAEKARGFFHRAAEQNEPYRHTMAYALYRPLAREALGVAELWRGITAASHQFEESFNRQDAVGVAALYTEDGQVLPTGAGIVAGRPAVEAFWQGVFDAGLTRAELETTEVYGAGAEATGVGRYALWAGDTLADEGKYIVVWRRTENGWKKLRDIFNTSRAPG